MGMKTCKITSPADAYNVDAVGKFVMEVDKVFFKGIMFPSMARCPFIDFSDGENIYFRGFNKSVKGYSNISPSGYARILIDNTNVAQLDVRENTNYDAEKKEIFTTIHYYETENSFEVVGCEGGVMTFHGGVVWSVFGEYQFIELKQNGTTTSQKFWSTKFPSNPSSPTIYNASSYELTSPDKLVLSSMFLGIDKLIGLYNIQFHSGTSVPREIEIEGKGKYTYFNGSKRYWCKSL